MTPSPTGDRYYSRQSNPFPYFDVCTVHLVQSVYYPDNKCTIYIYIYIYMHCATARTVSGSIPGGITGDFFPYVPREPCALGSTQLLKMSTRHFCWGKGGRCVRLTTYHPRNAERQENPGVLTYSETLGPPRPVVGYFYLYIYIYIKNILYIVSIHDL